MKKYTKKEAIAIVVRCAEKYHNELEGKNLLFICTDKHKKTFAVEASFYRNNYLHLTGIKSEKNFNGEAANLFANDFYQKCLEHKISPNDFDFADDGTTHMKLAVLPGLICKNLNAKIIGDYDSFKPKLYTEKIIGNVQACMGFVLDQQLLSYIPNTLIQEDVRNLTSTQGRVIAVFRKDIRAENYTEMTYKAPKVEYSSIQFPDRFVYLSRIFE